MKGRRKKLVVWLLVLSVIMSQATSLDVAATASLGSDSTQVTDTAGADDADVAEPAGKDTGTDETEPTQPDEGTQEGGDTAGIQNDGSANLDASANSDQSAKTDESVTPDASADSDKADEPDEDKKEEEEKKEDDEEAVSDLINYLVIGETQMQAPGEQNVVVSYGNGTEEITSVKLVVAGEDDKQIEIPLTEKIDNKYSFVKAYEQGDAGTYRLVAFRYEQDGRKKRVNLENIGISAQYTVSAETPEIEEECAEEPGISVTALTSDEISDDMTSDIEATIQEAADEAVENVVEGAVELGTSSTEKSNSHAVVNAAMAAAGKDGVMLGSYSTPKAYTGTVSTVVVVLDPGHGGSEVGSKITVNGKELYEKDFNLAIAQYCKAELERYNGVKVYMTRTDDSTLSLEGRVEAAKALGATIFVSIHMNAATDTSASGAEVYYPNANYNPTVSNEGKAAAQNILDELVDLGLADRGIKIRNSTDDSTYVDGSTADYYSVIRNSKNNGFPGIIVEHAFLTSKTDQKHLVQNGQMNRTFLKELGQADAQGIMKYCQSKTDYSPVYDFNYYLNRYPDLKNVYRGNQTGALQHFINYGMKEGRKASTEFDVDAYMDRYSDLKSAFGTNYESYYIHYINFGRKEGRIATTSGTSVNQDDNAQSNVKNNTPENTVYGGTDYGAVYNYEYYINRYSDIAAVYNGDYAGALRHFVMNGMNEGRQAIGTFNVNAYKYFIDNGYKDTSTKKEYPPLKLGYGDNLRLYYLYYIEHGKEADEVGRPTLYDNDPEGEGRNPDPSGTATQYGLVDYSLVYNFSYYVAHNDDVRRVYGQDDKKVLQHFIRHGMSEGRQGNEEFNVFGYKSRYSDLRAAFGDDLKQYYLHYINHGEAEKRTCTLERTTVYQGVDYGPTKTGNYGTNEVYNFDYYIGKYSDIYAAFANDPAGALQHFITNGIAEERQGCEGFSITAYKSNNSDLRNAFGDNDMAYIRHYMLYGYNEDRSPSSFILHDIVKSYSKEELEGLKRQMVMFFIANSSYPTYYATNTSVKSIDQFCDIYINECTKLGIDPAVAFCQAMKETSFLRFGGDVEIKQYNFAGLGATGNSAKGASFGSIEEGIRAHVQHLYAYAVQGANKNNLGGEKCVDPRFDYVTKGCAKYVEWLGQKENPLGAGWATAEEYGYSIVRNYMNKMETYSK